MHRDKCLSFDTQTHHSGSARDDRITGNASANTLRGGAGDDTLIGGKGSDTYMFAHGDSTGTGDTVTDDGGTLKFTDIDNVGKLTFAQSGTDDNVTITAEGGDSINIVNTAVNTAVAVNSNATFILDANLVDATLRLGTDRKGRSEDGELLFAKEENNLMITTEGSTGDSVTVNDYFSTVDANVNYTIFYKTTLSGGLTFKTLTKDDIATLV